MRRGHYSFLIFLYKYYYIKDNTHELRDFIHHNKKMFIFNFRSEGTHKLFVNEINYILSLNSSLTRDYLFFLCNITNNKKLSVKEGISFYDMNNFTPMPILDKTGLNKTGIDYKIFEYIYRDQNNLLKNQLDSSKAFMNKTFKSVFNWILQLTKDDTNNTNNTNDINEQNIQKKIENVTHPNIDIEQELIDEINKTIIEDNEKNKENEKKNYENHLKYFNIRRKNLYGFNEEEELGFNKNLIMFPLYLIIYSILYYFFYKYILVKFNDNISYIRLPTEDQKNK